MLVYIKPLSMFPKIHSDRLFGAFLSAISELFPSEIDEILNRFNNNNPPFLISSAFPVLVVNDDKIRFFPKLIDNEIKSFDQTILKDFNKVEYIEEEIFLKIINGKLSQMDILLNYGNYIRLNNLLLSKEYDKKIEIVSNITPHNSINRFSNETKIFYSDGYIYGKNTELFFFINIFDESYTSLIKSCLKFLKDRGFGRDISTGKGQFDYEIDENDFHFDNEMGNTDNFITLSRFIPSGDDLKYINEDCFYEIQSKRGIDKSGDKRSRVHFFKEGSTFNYHKKFHGKIVNVGKYKPAVEYGYAFPIKYVNGVD